jgi:hypothetical protein
MIDKEIVKEFVAESKNLIQQLVEMLENIEGDFTKVSQLAEYGNMVDRIMGVAKSLAMTAPENHALNVISDYASLCKAVGYKASQITTNTQLFDVCVALLLDGTETLDLLVDRLELSAAEIKKMIPTAFIERLRWVSGQFSSAYSESVGPKQVAMSQSEIDTLMAKLGI